MLFYNQYKEYLSQDGDRWDLIAYKQYGDCFGYLSLIMANPHVAISPVIPVGTKIVVPILEDERIEEGLPPWKTA